MNRPKRIVLAVTTYGSLLLLRDIPERLQERGWEVHLVSAPPAQGQRHTSTASTHFIPMERQIAALADVRALISWFRLLRGLRPSILVVGTPKASLLGMLAAYILRVPERIYTVRGLRLETARGFQRALLWLIERLTVDLATRVLCVSPSLRARLVELKLARNERLSVIHLGSSAGVDTQFFEPDPTPTDRAGVTIGFVGRISRDKGIDVLVASLRRLAFKGHSLRVLVAGPVEEPGGEKLLGDLLSVPKHDISYLGRVSDMRAVYGQIDLLVLPTLREGFPNVVLEAAAMRVPTLTTSATGARDSVVDGQTGWLVPPGDSSALARELARLTEAPELLRRAGLRGREHVVAHFDRNLISGAVVDWYLGEYQCAAEAESKNNRR